jgi:hypothetical protein
VDWHQHSSWKDFEYKFSEKGTFTGIVVREHFAVGPGKLYSASTLESYQKGKTFELPVHECTASYLHNRSALPAGLPEAVPAEPALCCHVPGCLYYWLQKHINKNRRTFKSRSLAESAKQVIKKIFTK